MLVSQYLKFDVMRFFKVLFNVDAVVADLDRPRGIDRGVHVGPPWKVIEQRARFRVDAEKSPKGRIAFPAGKHQQPRFTPQFKDDR